MTPLEKAKQKELCGGCDSCIHCVKVNTAHFCEISGKYLISWLMTKGHCMHNPSDYKRREDK